MRKGFLLIASFILFSFYVNGQTGSVEGMINSENNLPLSGVSVFIDGTPYGTTTNGQGIYRLRNIPTGEYSLIITNIGYRTVKKEISIEENQPLVLSEKLTELVITLPGVVVERVTMTGGNTGIVDIPGSAHYISPKEISKFNYNDINRVLRSIPGINIQEEDGFGLRPNIGMRGTGVERSSKITVMEDGILMAPAPYSAPAAYYFPTVGRMNAVEIAKGSTQIKYGPYTTGGAINFISTQIPTEMTGKLNLFAGSFGQRTLNASVGDSFDNFGFLVETYQTSAEGFKKLDSGGDTGFDKKDYLAKFRINTNATAPVYQSLTFKIGQTTEKSNETYLGLTENDFGNNPLRRYAGSQRDQMNTEQRQISLVHVIRPFNFMDITTTAYRTDFSRNWYKLDKVNGGSASVSISDILESPTTHSDEFGIITGTTSVNVDALSVKANNRDYYSQGIQTLIGFQFRSNEISHDIEVGLRVHKDQIDRYQWVDQYMMDNGVMGLTSSGEPGTESNQVTTANAIAAHIQYKLSIGKLTAVPGLRYENIELTKLNYGKSDPLRQGNSLGTSNNRVDVIIPGMGIDYKFNDRWNVFVGVHRGFSPPASSEASVPEKSINYELGSRFNKGGLSGMAVVFVNDYDNLLGSDLAATGGAGSNDQFNGGQVLAKGLEFQLNYDFLSRFDTKFSLPVSLTYTFTDAEFLLSFESEFEGWGTVTEGDKLPYLARNQLSVNAGFETGKFRFNINSRYMDEMRTVAGQGEILDQYKTDKYYVTDVSSEYFISREISLFGSLKNITNETYVVARRPAGLRPGLPRAFILGIKATL
ncbi:MAG: TonB-dependent receptor [Bacteroidetes bacterium]|nr:TonB-dependent receptor [Bacteroidota bacterium]MDA1119162.1 TonB-dependent receptor [Bacteroidota bacterium]